MDNITVTERPFLPHDLLDLLKTLRELNNKDLTQQVAVSLLLINNPPKFLRSPA